MQIDEPLHNFLHLKQDMRVFSLQELCGSGQRLLLQQHAREMLEHIFDMFHSLIKLFLKLLAQLSSHVFYTEHLLQLLVTLKDLRQVLIGALGQILFVAHSGKRHQL
jgi:hypothetical protein